MDELVRPDGVVEQVARAGVVAPGATVRVAGRAGMVELDDRAEPDVPVRLVELVRKA